MAKITISGEVFDFDRDRKPLAEAIMIEKDLGIRYAQYESDLLAGSARAIAEFIRVVWLRNGRDVPLADIESGKVEVDLWSIEADDAQDEPEADPKESPAPAGTPGTGPATRRSSRKSST